MDLVVNPFFCRKTINKFIKFNLLNLLNIDPRNRTVKNCATCVKISLNNNYHLAPTIPLIL